jgi:hypothetical protein
MYNRAYPIDSSCDRLALLGVSETAVDNPLDAI